MSGCAQTPTISTITLTAADLEYAIAIPNGVKQFGFFTRHATAQFRISWRSGIVAFPLVYDNYRLVSGTDEYYVENVDVRNMSVYVATTVPASTLCFEYWS